MNPDLVIWLVSVDTPGEFFWVVAWEGMAEALGFY